MEDHSFLADVLVFLAAAVIAVPIFQRLKSSLILGYLAAGLIIGPHVFGLVRNETVTRALAELGVIFLLFTIGLELTIDRLRVIRRYIFGLGTVQVVVTGAIIGLLATAAAISTQNAIVIGGALALSSTAVVMQLLSERGEMATRVGRVAFSILLLQDLAVVPLLAIVPALGGAGEDVVWVVLFTVVKAIIAVAAIFAFGRLVLRPVFRLIAVGQSPEMFAAMTLMVLLGTSWATASFGLSLAIGGFIAGMLLGETEYRMQVAAEIAPFRGLLLGLFFMTVGLDLDLQLIYEKAGLVTGLVTSLILGKTGLLALVARLSGQPWGASVRLGLLLSQGGEFAFILFGLAARDGIMPTPVADLMVGVVAVSMALTPILAWLGERFETHLEERSTPEEVVSGAEVSDMQDHVIIAGFGRVGQSVAKMLATAGIPYVAVEFEPTRVSEARSQGLPVYYGDASRSEVQKALGAERARAAVVIMDNAEAASRTVHLLHQRHPNIDIFVRARDNRHRRTLEEAGATGIVHETFEMSLQLGGAVLRRLGTPADDIFEIIQNFRAEDYAPLSDVIFPAESDPPPERRRNRDRRE
jgi:CPA2 family monovalent cation:H+ antiporter-2